MSRWEDPRLGVYRSAVQKLIRRGDVDSSIAAAQVLLSLPGGRTALARRLPVIAAEDVAIEWIPTVVVVTSGLRNVRDEVWFDAELVGLTAGLARQPKNKDA